MEGAGQATACLADAVVSCLKVGHTNSLNRDRDATSVAGKSEEVI